jgi:hypothetical protein
MSPRAPRRPPAPRRGRPSTPEVPTFESALDALLNGNPTRAVALFARRALADPKDWISRANRHIALYHAGRWAEAATGFEQDIARDGILSHGAVPALFCIGYCRLQLDDAKGSLAATTAFLNLGNAAHPFYKDGLENTACAWERLGQEAMAADLRGGDWSREKVIAASFRLLVIRGRPLPPREIDWYADAG